MDMIPIHKMKQSLYIIPAGFNSSLVLPFPHTDYLLGGQVIIKGDNLDILRWKDA